MCHLGFEPRTKKLCSLTWVSPRVGLYLSPPTEIGWARKPSSLYTFLFRETQAWLGIGICVIQLAFPDFDFLRITYYYMMDPFY